MRLDKANQKKYKYIYVYKTIDKLPSVDFSPKFGSFFYLCLRLRVLIYQVCYTEYNATFFIFITVIQESSI